MQVNITELKKLLTKISLAVEKTKINPMAGWIEILTDNDSLTFKISNQDYYLESTILAETYTDNVNEMFHVTVLAETFIPLISKLDIDIVDINEKANNLFIEGTNIKYTIPLIKENNMVKQLKTIPFNATTDTFEMDGNDIASVCSINAKGLVDALISQKIQSYIYIDNIGALTFTENMYVNTFSKPNDAEFKMLLTGQQAKLLEIFKDEDKVEISFEQKPVYDEDYGNSLSNKVCIATNNITLILITQNLSLVEVFPSVRLRALAETPTDTHVYVDKKSLDKALARLMIFDKKWGIDVLTYSKIVFKANELELVSIINKNSEVIPYLKSNNAYDREVVVRFADLVKQLKPINTKEIDISYSDRHAIVFNTSFKQIIPEIVMRKTV